MSNAIILAQHNTVFAVDVIQPKVDLINSKKSPIVDKEVEKYLATKELDIIATIDGDRAYGDSELVIIATPTNYDSITNKFDISSVESVIKFIVHSGACSFFVYKSFKKERSTSKKWI